MEPSLSQIPKIFEFLWHGPFEKETGNLGEKIRDQRMIHELTQKKLADQLGIDQTIWRDGKEENIHHLIYILIEL